MILFTSSHDSIRHIPLLIPHHRNYPSSYPSSSPHCSSPFLSSYSHNITPPPASRSHLSFYHIISRFAPFGCTNEFRRKQAGVIQRTLFNLITLALASLSYHTCLASRNRLHCLRACFFCFLFVCLRVWFAKGTSHYIISISIQGPRFTLTYWVVCMYALGSVGWFHGAWFGFWFGLFCIYLHGGIGIVVGELTLLDIS